MSWRIGQFPRVEDAAAGVASFVEDKLVSEHPQLCPTRAKVDAFLAITPLGNENHHRKALKIAICLISRRMQP